MIYPLCLTGHPHIFINQRITIVYKNKIMDGLRINWTFDKFFSESFISDYDKNRNKKFDKNEIVKIKAEAFESLKDYNYFSYFIVSGKKIKVNTVKDFSADISPKKKLIYNFYICFKTNKISPAREFIFGVFDETIFTDIAFEKKNPVVITPSNMSGAVSYKILDNSKKHDYSRAIYEIKISEKK